MATNGAGEDDPRDLLDAQRARIRSGNLSCAERDQLDLLIVGVAVAGRRDGRTQPDVSRARP
jgi:hypothetical protein